MRFFIIEHGLINRGGHHYMEARHFRKVAKQHAVETVILANKQIQDDICKELDAIPLFHYKPYDKPSTDPVSGPLENFAYLGEHMSSALSALGEKGPRADDILVSTITTQNELIGIAYWLKNQHQDRRPFLALNFMLDNITSPGESPDRLLLNPRITPLYRFGIKQILAHVPESRVLLTTGNPKFSGLMTNVLNHKTYSFPLPVCHEIYGDPIHELAGDDPVVAFLGHNHNGKVSDLIVPTIRRVWQSNPGTRFLLQGNPAELAKNWRLEFNEEIKSGSIYLVSGAVDQETYNRYLISSDIIFLPYKEQEYRIRTSGIFSEALSLGKVTVAPDGTWMSDVLQQIDGGGVIFRGQNIESYSRSIISALETLPSLRQKAMRQADEWKDKMGMNAFVEGIIDFYNTGKVA